MRAKMAKWEGLADTVAVKIFVERVVKEAEVTKWERLRVDAVSIKSFMECVVEEAWVDK